MSCSIWRLPIVPILASIIFLIAIAGLPAEHAPPASVAATDSLACNGPPVSFETGIPPDWPVIDNEGAGLIWTTVAGSGELLNYTGGQGEAASVSSDIFNENNGQTEFDTELHSNSFSLAEYGDAAMRYQANYEHLSEITYERDYLDLEINVGGSAGWATLTSWDEDHGTHRNLPGEDVTTDLTPYAGMPQLILRWHYYDPYDGDNDWYAQIDDTQLSCWVTAPFGDVDCSGALNATDALKLLRHNSGLSVSRFQPCPPLGAGVHTLVTPSRPMGDIDCSGAVNSVDALKTLRYAAGLSVDQSAQCPAIGLAADLYF